MTRKRLIVAVVLSALVGVPALMSPGLGALATLCALTYILWLRSR